MSAQYYRITRRLGTPHVNAVTVTVPLVGPVGPAGPAGPKGDPGEVSGSLAWDNVTDKPSTFPPSAHTHVAADITDFTSAVEAVSPPADWNTLANKPSTFPPSSHGHVAAEISDFTTAAAAAAPVQSVAGKTGSVTLAKADVGLGNVDNTSDTNKPISSATQSALDGKAALSHTHTASQVTDFNTAAAAAAPVQSVNGNTGTVTVAVPSASTATPQALGTAAAGTSDDYSRADHIHAAPALNDLSNVSAATPSDNDVLTFDTATSTWVSAAPAGGGSSGTKTYAVFTPDNNQPTATDFATLDTRNSIAVLDFDDAATESAVFVGILPEAADVSSGLIVSLRWMATTATSGDVRWSVSWEKSNTDLDSDSFDTATAATATANGTSGIVAVTNITCTTIDSLAAGDLFRLRVQRVGGDGADTMTGDAELVAVEVRSAA
jgi:hypothetical protein